VCDKCETEHKRWLAGEKLSIPVIDSSVDNNKTVCRTSRLVPVDRIMRLYAFANEFLALFVESPDVLNDG
jgi:hypothetical protein